MKGEVSDTKLYCHPGGRKSKGQRIDVRKRVLNYQKVKVRMFTILPETCPAGLTVNCERCDYSQDVFRVRKQLSGTGDNPGFIECSYAAKHEAIRT